MGTDTLNQACAKFGTLWAFGS